MKRKAIPSPSTYLLDESSPTLFSKCFPYKTKKKDSLVLMSPDNEEIKFDKRNSCCIL